MRPTYVQTTSWMKRVWGSRYAACEAVLSMLFCTAVRATIGTMPRPGGRVRAATARAVMARATAPAGG